MVRVGVVGCGVISSAHLKAWVKVPEYTVNGVFDVNQQLAQKRAFEFSIPTTFENITELISASEVVDVCTPPHTHAQIAMQVIQSGKHLVIEKPVVTDLAEWEAICRQLASSPTQIAAIHNIKFSESVQRAKSWV